MELKVVVNASPLIFLSKAQLLKILKFLYTTVYTTREVMREVEEPLKLGIEAPEILVIRSVDWINVVELKAEEKEDAKRLADLLGISIGEAEATILYKRGFDLLVVADRKAERKLKSVGVNVVDVLDVGLEAATKGIVDIEDFANRVWKAGYRTERVERFLRIDPGQNSLHSVSLHQGV